MHATYIHAWKSFIMIRIYILSSTYMHTNLQPTGQSQWPFPSVQNLNAMWHIFYTCSRRYTWHMSVRVVSCMRTCSNTCVHGVPTYIHHTYTIIWYTHTHRRQLQHPSQLSWLMMPGSRRVTLTLTLTLILFKTTPRHRVPCLVLWQRPTLP